MARPIARETPPLLLLGRLDGRLQHSPAADIWQARARLRGVASLSDLAGVSVTEDQLTDWICGRSLPPRSSEGLNDPMSIAAVLHFALTAQEADPDPVALATLNVLRSLLDDRAAVETWAVDDLLRFGAAFRVAKDRMEAPYPTPSLRAVAERIIETQAAVSVQSTAGPVVTSVDGRELHIEPRSFDTLWLVACFIPSALVSAGLTQRALPSLVSIPKFLPGSAELLADRLEASLGATVHRELDALDRLEKLLAMVPTKLGVTKRSKAPTLLRLMLAYPGLRTPSIARLLGISHQGATKLKRLLDVASEKKGDQI